MCKDEVKRRYCPHCGSELMRDHPKMVWEDDKPTMVELSMVLRCRVCPDGYKEYIGV